MAPLHVVTMISNPVRFSSRYRLYKEFEQHMFDSGVILHTVEVAFGDRAFEVTQKDNPRHLQLRTRSEIWHKETALNEGVKKLIPHDAKYLAFVDADVHFQRRDWAEETVHQLQHYDVVQCFVDALDLGPKGEVLEAQRPRKSFCYQYHEMLLCKDPPVGPDGHYAAYWHPGYAWAMTMDAYHMLGGLLDTCVAGSADYHMAMGLIGKCRESLWKGADGAQTLHPDYVQSITDWGDNAIKNVCRNIGYVEGTLLHEWHGKKGDRGYLYREDILARRQYSPARHLRRDTNGLYQLCDDSGELRDELRFYFRKRNEDSVDI